MHKIKCLRASAPRNLRILGLKMSELYEIVIFTASLSQYANPLINRLDKNCRGYYQLYREHCTFFKNMYFVKDLSKLGRDLKDVIIIDNSPSAYMFHPENAIAITSWYQSKIDRELARLIPLLTDLADVEDVRKHLGGVHKLKSNNSSAKTAISGSLPATPRTTKVSKSARIMFKRDENVQVLYEVSEVY
jgi:Dullard-like phosphatase family protein